MLNYNRKKVNRGLHNRSGTAVDRNRFKPKQDKKRRRGAIAVLSAFLMIGLLTFAAFTVDLGHLVLVRTELQVAADSSAMAAAAAMHMPRKEMLGIASTFAGYHKAGNEQVVLDPADVEYGIWDSATRRFTPTAEPGNAVRVTARAGGADRDGVDMFFGPLVNLLKVRQDASAVAMANPRDIAFVVDLSGSMNDDAEPCWATDAIDKEFGSAGFGNLGTKMLQELFDDFGFGSAPGTVEYIGESWGIPSNKFAYAELSDNAGPFTAQSVPAQYRINMSDNELTRKKKVYSAIIDFQLARIMPDAKPTPDSSQNYEYWSRYLDYIIEPVKLKVKVPKPDDGGGDKDKSGGGGGDKDKDKSGGGGGGAPKLPSVPKPPSAPKPPSIPKPPAPPKPPTGMILPERLTPVSSHSLFTQWNRPGGTFRTARRFQLAHATTTTTLASNEAWIARMLLAKKGGGGGGGWDSGSGSGWSSDLGGSKKSGKSKDKDKGKAPGSGSDSGGSPSDLPGTVPGDTGGANWGGQSTFDPETSNRGTVPPNQSKNRITGFNNPNKTAFPGVSSNKVKWWRNRLGYVSYVQFMTDFGRDMQPDDATFTPLSANSPECPYHSEETRGGTFDFPPRTQPMHATRRALIAAIEVVKERNKSIGAVEQRDWVSIITFDLLSDGGPVIVQPLTGDYEPAKQACTILQACGDKSASTATEAGLQVARDHITAASKGGQGREATNKVIVLLTDGAPNLYTTPPDEIDDYMQENPSGDFYADGSYWFDAPLMQAGQMSSNGWSVFPVSVGLGADYDFMDRMSRMGGTAGDDGQGSRGSDNPAEYEQRLIEIFEKIITSPKVRLVQ